jgi:hypothetical protein
MKKNYIFLIWIILILNSTSLLASPPPDLITTIPSQPPIDAEFPSQPNHQPIINQPNPDAVKYLSGVPYFATFKSSGNAGQQSALAYQPSNNTAITQPAPASTVVATVNMTTDTNQDVEPSVISIDKSGTIWTTTVYTKFVAGIAKNYFSTTSDFAT